MHARETLALGSARDATRSGTVTVWACEQATKHGVCLFVVARVSGSAPAAHTRNRSTAFLPRQAATYTAVHVPPIAEYLFGSAPFASAFFVPGRSPSALAWSSSACAASASPSIFAIPFISAAHSARSAAVVVARFPRSER